LQLIAARRRDPRRQQLVLAGEGEVVERIVHLVAEDEERDAAVIIALVIVGLAVVAIMVIVVTAGSAQVDAEDEPQSRAPSRGRCWWAHRCRPSP
jgi:hypothetical protein